MISDDQMLDVVRGILAREGGFVNDPLDRGGATNYGITQAALSEFLSDLHGELVTVTPEDVKKLTPEEATKIYVEKYIKGENLHYIPDYKLFELVVDCGVNHGVKRAIRWLQLALGTDSDGIIGRQTKLLLEEVGGDATKINRVYKKICARRIRFYVDLVLGKPDQIRFLRGWINRATSFLEA